MLIEQAIFTSAKTDRAQGYQLLSRSPLLSEADARELSLWGPSHGSLLDEAEPTGSANFFRLESGSYCVSRTTIAGAEYSGRGASVYTQFLIVPPEVLARFANNPFAILRAAAASGALAVLDPVPESLPSVQLAGRAPVVDLGLMAQIARDPGPGAMATLVQTALASDKLAFYCETPCEHLIAGLFNVLPVECRTEFSFTTGLVHSPARPVRISALPSDEGAWRALGRHGITLLRLISGATSDVGWEGWAAWVAMLLESGKLSVLASELEQPRPGLTCADLDALGEHLVVALHSGHLRSQASKSPESTAAPEGEVSVLTGSRPRKGLAKARRAMADLQQRADQAHPTHKSSVVVETPARTAELDALAAKLAKQPAPILEMLERVDDLVFTAISGDTQALAELEVLWPLMVMELDADLVEQSREQYLRCALAICADATEGEVRRPQRAMAAVDVLCVLFEE